MKINTDIQKINELLERGVNETIEVKHMKEQLTSGRKLRVKLGIDPTSPNLHLGRAVALLKLRDFQLLGHQIVFIVGDFTGVIGDTSDKESERPMLLEKQVKENMKTYLKQAAKILDIEKTEAHYNSTWLKKLGYKEIGAQADQFSLSDFVSRENIKKRLETGKRVSLREVLYPLMQGYDSVAVRADVEIGGVDQRFNLLAGRSLQNYYKQTPQDILMTNLIPGTDGRKMSSSWGNTINIADEPKEIFGKIMSMPDNVMLTYFEHCTRIPIEKIKEYEKQLNDKKTNPADIKIDLAYEITKLCWNEKKAEEAKNYFVSVFRKGKTPTEVTEFKLAGKNIIDALIQSGLAKSKSDARRLVEQNSIKINSETVTSIEEIVQKNDFIQKGRRFFVKIV